MKNRVREFLKAMPFRPFIIKMADGSAHHVAHPEFVLASPETPQIIIEAPNGDITYLSVLLITSVEHAPASNARAKKGHSAKP
jgi:hypothetical protein